MVGTGKGKDILVDAMKAHRRNRGIAPEFLKLGRTWR
jgi:hypothetical protein